jgi:hypothetical protein
VDHKDWVPGRGHRRGSGLVLVPFDVQALGGGGVPGAGAGVLAERGLGVGLAPDDEGGLRGGDVLLLAEPLLEGALLQRAAEGEGERPGLEHLQLVHGVQVLRRLLLALPAGQEHHTGHRRRHRAPQRRHRVLRDHLRANLCTNCKWHP